MCGRFRRLVTEYPTPGQRARRSALLRSLPPSPRSFPLSLNVPGQRRKVLRLCLFAQEGSPIFERNARAAGLNGLGCAIDSRIDHTWMEMLGPLRCEILIHQWSLYFCSR